ncbi:MAG: VPLPA-CTERM sorting domain-containing protein [Gammaproteobacteria bacterium]
MNSINAKRLVAIGAAGLIGLLSTGTQAAVVCNGLLTGTTCALAGPNVTWVFDVNTQDFAGQKFGAPTLIGDAVRFLPSAFSADSLNGAGAASTSRFFIFDRVFSNAGGEIASITTIESGDYFITNGVSVGAQLYTQITNNDPNYAFEFATNTQSFSAVSPTNSAVTPWSLSGTLTPAASFIGSAKDISFGLQNTLQALTSTAASEAFIQKKFSIDVIAVVPVPAAAWLFASGLGLLGMARRRRVI